MIDVETYRARVEAYWARIRRRSKRLKKVALVIALVIVGVGAYLILFGSKEDPGEWITIEGEGVRVPD